MIDGKNAAPRSNSAESLTTKKLLLDLFGHWFRLARNWTVRTSRKLEKTPELPVSVNPHALYTVWSNDYGLKKKNFLFSTLLQAAFCGSIVGLTVLGAKTTQTVKKVDTASAVDISPWLPDYSECRKGPNAPGCGEKSGGGGGGGDRDKLQAPIGKLPKRAMEQFTPPVVVIRNLNPRLPMEPTVVVPPQVKVPMPNVPTLGDPLTGVLGPPSNGTGSGGGIGSGKGGGVGSGIGPGVGPGRGGGIGGGAFRVGGGVSAPKVIYSPDPEYSEEARKAKYQGTVVLWIVVGADGRVHDIKVSRALGMGLDEKAVQAVKDWRFDPGRKEGRPVAVQVNVEVNFHLY